MAYEFVTLTASSNGSGVGSATDPVFRNGKLLAIGLDFASSTDAGCDTTLAVTGPAGPAQTLLVVTDSKTDGWFFPRAGAVTTANVAITNSHVEIPFFGNLTLSIAQAGASVTNAVSATLFIDTGI